MSEMAVAFLLVLYLYFCYNKGNELTKENLHYELYAFISWSFNAKF